METSEHRQILVTAAVIRDQDDRILLARRPAGSHMGGLWEFPGGKVQPGESPTAALVRELDEELGIRAEVGDLITTAVHSEPGLRIVLQFFAARITAGTPRPREGQEVAWVAVRDLDRYPTPPADAELVQLLSGGRVALPW